MGLKYCQPTSLSVTYGTPLPLFASSRDRHVLRIENYGSVALNVAFDFNPANTVPGTTQAVATFQIAAASASGPGVWEPATAPTNAIWVVPAAAGTSTVVGLEV
jgi:hypothetical protein